MNKPIEEKKDNKSPATKRPVMPMRAESRLLKSSAKKASLKAKRISKALDLPIQIIRNGELMEEYPNGDIRTIKRIKKVKSKIQVKKGTVVCLKSKD